MDLPKHSYLIVFIIHDTVLGAKGAYYEKILHFIYNITKLLEVVEKFRLYRRDSEITVKPIINVSTIIDSMTTVRWVERNPQ